MKGVAWIVPLLGLAGCVVSPKSDPYFWGKIPQREIPGNVLPAPLAAFDGVALGDDCVPNLQKAEDILREYHPGWVPGSSIKVLDAQLVARDDHFVIVVARESLTWKLPRFPHTLQGVFDYGRTVGLKPSTLQEFVANNVAAGRGAIYGPDPVSNVLDFAAHSPIVVTQAFRIDDQWKSENLIPLQDIGSDFWSLVTARAWQTMVAIIQDRCDERIAWNYDSLDKCFLLHPAREQLDIQDMHARYMAFRNESSSKVAFGHQPEGPGSVPYMALATPTSGQGTSAPGEQQSSNRPSVVSQSTVNYQPKSLTLPMSLRVTPTETRTGDTRWGWLGATELDLSAGVTLVEVTPGSAADGLLEVNDVITQIQGVYVRSFLDLRFVIAHYHAGDRVAITVRRAGRVEIVHTTLGPKPS